VVSPRSSQQSRGSWLPTSPLLFGGRKGCRSIWHGDCVHWRNPDYRPRQGNDTDIAMATVAVLWLRCHRRVRTSRNSPLPGHSPACRPLPGSSSSASSRRRSRMFFLPTASEGLRRKHVYGEISDSGILKRSEAARDLKAQAKEFRVISWVTAASRNVLLLRFGRSSLKWRAGPGGPAAHNPMTRDAAMYRSCQGHR